MATRSARPASASGSASKTGKTSGKSSGKAPRKPSGTSSADLRAEGDRPSAKTDRSADPAPKDERSGKQRKARKPVRDSFTMPSSDFALIAQLKERALAQQREAKKSELLRAGLHALNALAPAALVVALDALEPVKTGRPKKDR